MGVLGEDCLRYVWVIGKAMKTETTDKLVDDLKSKTCEYV